MEMSYEDYCKRVLESKKMERENLTVNHRIAIAVYNAKLEAITEQITSLERQIGE